MTRVDPCSRHAPIALPSRSTCVALRAEPKSVPVARTVVKELLGNYGAVLAEEAADTAFLVVTELFTNAVVHSNATTILLALRITDGNLWVDVTDNGVLYHGIQERSASELDENGRGLLLVRTLSRSWGKRTSCLGTKVWAVLPLMTRCSSDSFLIDR
ncbi:ATP-binding protein [Streptomyces roseus]|uniref:ATP-binding protein n=1 Tax=Streptomyces roseus TaxID=66430 RepID=UPI00381DF6A2